MRTVTENQSKFYKNDFRCVCMCIINDNVTYSLKVYVESNTSV